MYRQKLDWVSTLLWVGRHTGTAFVTRSKLIFKSDMFVLLPLELAMLRHLSRSVVRSGCIHELVAAA